MINDDALDGELHVWLNILLMHQVGMARKRRPRCLKTSPQRDVTCMK